MPDDSHGTPDGSARVRLRAPTADDREVYLAKVLASRRFHRPWVYPPASPQGYADYLARCRQPNFVGLFVWVDVGAVGGVDGTAELAGVINVSEIVRGPLQSAYLGFYALHPFQGSGCMGRALPLALRVCFRSLKLHRVEANIQPANAPSKRLVRRCGFHREGYSRRYLKVGGRWRDHERWALLAESDR